MNGFVIYRGPSLLDGSPIVAIATLESENEKTGNMVQIWILPALVNPLDALKANNNKSICGRCPLQGRFDPIKRKMIDRVCYVNVGQAPAGIWKAYQRGAYPDYQPRLHRQYLADREIRHGAYGDPAALPVKLVRYFAHVGRSWTGYSHQLFWIDQRRANELAKYLMCSCHTPAQRMEAKRRGWRVFEAIAEGQVPPADSVECPFYSHGVQCIDCQLCQGTSKKAKSIYAIAHGRVGANLPRVQAMQGAAI